MGPATLHERGQLVTDVEGSLATAALALVEAARRTPPAPSAEDVARLRRILELVGEIPARAREGKLNDAIRAERLVVGDRYDRRHVIETLGACAILETPEHRGFTTRWTSWEARQESPSVRVETRPPIAFWTAGHGVNAEAVTHWFGHLGVEAPASAAPRAAHVAAARERELRRQRQRAARQARATELCVGDALAFPVGERWIAAVVVDLWSDEGGTRPVLELVDWSGDEPPALGALRGRPARGHAEQRERLIVADAWKRDDRRGRWRCVGGGLPPPPADHLAPPRGLGVLSRAGEIVERARQEGLV